jgi:hypothetical protein
LHHEPFRTIRREHAAGSFYAALARQFSISECTIRDIIKGRTWKEREV